MQTYEVLLKDVRPGAKTEIKLPEGLRCPVCLTPVGSSNGVQLIINRSNNSWAANSACLQLFVECANCDEITGPPGMLTNVH